MAMTKLYRLQFSICRIPLIVRATVTSGAHDQRKQGFSAKLSNGNQKNVMQKNEDDRRRISRKPKSNLYSETNILRDV